MILNVGSVYIYKKNTPVFIIYGSYMGEYGVSNYWYWKKILKDGSLSKKIYSDYDNKGHFSSYIGKVEVKINLVV